MVLIQPPFDPTELYHLKRDLLALVTYVHWAWLAEMRVPDAEENAELARREMSLRFVAHLWDLEERRPPSFMRVSIPVLSDVFEAIQLAEEWPAIAADIGYDDGIVVGIDVLPAFDTNGQRIPDNEW